MGIVGHNLVMFSSCKRGGVHEYTLKACVCEFKVRNLAFDVQTSSAMRLRCQTLFQFQFGPKLVKYVTTPLQTPFVAPQTCNFAFHKQQHVSECEEV